MCVGVCLYVITAGALPFDEPNLGALFSKISRADYHTPAWFSEELGHLLHAIINPKPNERCIFRGCPFRVRRCFWKDAGLLLHICLSDMSAGLDAQTVTVMPPQAYHRPVAEASMGEQRLCHGAAARASAQERHRQ